MKRLYRLLFAMFILNITSCSNKQTEVSTADSLVTKASVKQDTILSEEDNYAFFQNINNYLTDKKYDTAIMQVIDSSAAIIINPTDEQIKQMEKEMSEEDMATVADDASYYQSDASLRLDSNNIKTIDAVKPYILLKGRNKSWTLDIRKKGAPEWNIILFNISKEPEIISGIDVTTEKIETYFTK